MTMIVVVLVFSILVLWDRPAVTEVVNEERASLQFSSTELPLVSAQAWLIFDLETGTVINSHNKDLVYPIASVTKLMAAQSTLNSEVLWATTTVTWSDLNADGRSGRLSYGDRYLGHTLLFPMLLESSNDAATTLSRFDESLVGRMNQKVEELGITDTQFVDASGLSMDNQSSVESLMKLSTDVFRHDRHLIDISGLDSYLGKQQAWQNNSPFINFTGYLGGKHGYLPEAGRSATLFFDDNLNGGVSRTLGYVLLGSEDLVSDVRLLRTYVKETVSWE